jgi:hypothetical protein
VAQPRRQYHLEGDNTEIVRRDREGWRRCNVLRPRAELLQHADDRIVQREGGAAVTDPHGNLVPAGGAHIKW